MHTDELIEKVLAASQIPSNGRRREVARELRAHIEDFVLVAREAGHTEEEIERLVVENFGDPAEIAREFAWVYRRERAILRIAVFLLSTLTVAGAIAASVFAVQALLALSLGAPALVLLGGRHLTMEGFYFLSTAAAYVGLISLERLFDRARLERAVAVLAVCFAIAGLALTYTIGHAEMLIFAFFSGVVLRVIQLAIKHRAARMGAVIGCFAMVGLISACRQSPGTSAVLQLTVWVAIGVCCHLMTLIAARVNRALLNEVQ